ncbi:hypothetical protein [Marinomonas rhodophyticola]|uniref:Multidrug resistance protein MdtA-like C-terminal permuted SH3 domain-containing protein n=1 Tax=Marinomonas rhodophyticola TaxID=2992803 RepID=A0ABT3KJ08_9GAMM|nr:hypothetical protein [Marinomonas sp. KJ51-3]MCW4630533.1 hypothetical protein [Marinomonas sp. KJ51-3]
MYVRVEAVQSHSAQAILIPQRAVMRSNNGAFVYIVNDQNTVEVRSIVTGFNVAKLVAHYARAKRR